MTAKTKVGQILYWWAVGVGAISVLAGLIAAFKGQDMQPLLVSGAFAVGAWLFGRAARDILSG